MKRPQADDAPRTGTSTVPPLVSTAWVAERLDAQEFVLVEVDEEAGTYYEGHLPGARNADWLDHLQHPVRRAMLDEAAFEKLMDRFGITNDTHVVLYGDAWNFFAASAYWIFRFYGHRRLSLMDGGRQLWLAEDRKMSEVLPEAVAATGYRVREHRPQIRATRDDMLQRFVGAPAGTALIDCRTPEEYAGQVVQEVDLPVARHRMPGRIPGARHLATRELVDPTTGRLRPREELQALYAERGVTDEVEVAVYCRVAERSSLLWFVLEELLRHPHVRNYDGGWAEYGSLIDAPVERDPA